MVKGINLVPDDVKRGWFVRRVRRTLYAAVIVCVFFLLYVFTGQYNVIRTKNAETSKLEREKAELAAQSSAYAELTGKLSSVRQKQEEVKKRLEAAGVLTKGRILWSGVLKRLSADIPKDVWLRALSTADAQGSLPAQAGGKRMRILGSSLTNKGITEFVFMLENSGVYTDVTLSYAQKKEANGAPVYDFEAYASVKPGAESGGL
ncbi:MAG: PilN domain-containing protein [Deltaproteobacteria bacterium]|nr:PilN domain-containing protein [Deltaproteobacteria bacterium]